MVVGIGQLSHGPFLPLQSHADTMELSTGQIAEVQNHPIW